MLPNPKPEKSAPVRPPAPPPLPGDPPAHKAGVLDRLKASITIVEMRAIYRARRLWALVKRRPIVSGISVAVIALAAAAAVAVATDSLPDVELDLLSPATVTDARANARSHPNDPAAQRDFGHALWASKRRHAAVARYARALAIDPGVADDEMIANLVASFGGGDQRKAEALIWKSKLTGAERGLEQLVSSKRHGVRWGAVRTLDKLDKSSRANWEKAYVLDLEESECEVRRAAVEKLGAIGTRRALPALKSARENDEKADGWFSKPCLGGRLDDAEQKILSRR